MHVYFAAQLDNVVELICDNPETYAAVYAHAAACNARESAYGTFDMYELVAHCVEETLDLYNDSADAVLDEVLTNMRGNDIGFADAIALYVNADYM